MRFQEVEELKQAVNDKRKNLTKEQEQAICEAFDVQYVYESTSFENGDFSYEDIVFLLEDHSRQFPDKSEASRKAIINNYHAMKKVHELVRDGVEMNEDLIKDLHQMLVDGIINGGVYRTRDLFILGAKHVPPTYLKIYAKMDRYFQDLNNPELKGLEKAAFALLQLLKIYPFMDANGRLARLILNYQLELEGYLPISITKDLRNDYYHNIDEYKINKKIEPFTAFIAKLEAKRMKTFLERE